MTDPAAPPASLQYPPPRRRGAKPQKGGGDLGFEAKLWQAADKLRGNLDASEYKHVVLGLIFLKYVADSFEERRRHLLRETADPTSAYYVADEKVRHEIAEDRDEYTAENVFWVPPEARWERLQAQAKQPTIGQAIDDAMAAIERENPRLKGVLPREYGRPTLDKRRLGELIDLIGTIGLGDAANRSKDILGRVYEYFLGQFASVEGKRGGEFYTPRPIVRLLVEMLAPRESARVYDPCCGSGGMFVQSETFVEAHGGRRGAVAVYGQELNHTTWRMCQMNLAIRKIEAHIAQGDTFHEDKFPDLRADFILANPPFNVSDWGGDRLQRDVRWKYGVPPIGNANYAWIQHFVHHLAPNGIAGFVLANGSMSSNSSGEGHIRRRIVEADLVDCVVSLPGELFYTTQIQVCLWLLARNKRDIRYRNRCEETLFIDARRLGRMTDRIHRELTDEEIRRISAAYRAWRGDQSMPSYSDHPGFCRTATSRDIGHHRWCLVPGRYVGFAPEERADCDLAGLRKELSDAERRLNHVASMSAGALAVLKELLNG